MSPWHSALVCLWRPLGSAAAWREMKLITKRYAPLLFRDCVVDDADISLLYHPDICCILSAAGLSLRPRFSEQIQLHHFSGDDLHVTKVVLPSPCVLSLHLHC